MRNLKGGRFGNPQEPNSGKTSGIWIFNEIDDYIEESKWPPQPDSSLIQYFVFNESLKTNYDHYQLLYANNDNFNDYGDFSRAALNLEYLIVGGGGGGGMDMGGGGGGGGVLTGNTILTTSITTTITVGAGGWGAPAGGGGYRGDGVGPQPNTHQFTIGATNGGNSSFLDLTAIGGGAGGSSYYDHTLGGRPSNGGSGGGSSGYSNGSTRAGGLGTPGQGFNGGQGGGQYYSGGGGGAGGAGINSPSRPDGGPGKLSSILGQDLYWGGGGGGAAYSAGTGGNGGIGGGGGGAVGVTTGGAGYNNGSAGGGGANNAQTNKPGGNGGANTGGGGGGGSHYNLTNAGGNGGSGIVVLCYYGPLLSNISASLTYTLNTNLRPGLNLYIFTAGTGQITLPF